MKLGLMGLIGESRLIGELLAFAGDAFADAPRAQPSSKPILLIPGFMAADATLYPLAARLRRGGHRVFFAGIWCNAGCPARTADRLHKSLSEASRSAGAKVIVIGHSLGGIYARELARRFPELVERAILLGSPLRQPLENLNESIRALPAAMHVAHRRCVAAVLGEGGEKWRIDLASKPPEVPETIIYSRSDGLVNWQSCIERGPRVEAIEVASSHCGLPLNLDVWRVISERLVPGWPSRNCRPSQVVEFRRPAPV